MSRLTPVDHDQNDVLTGADMEAFVVRMEGALNSVTDDQIAEDAEIHVDKVLNRRSNVVLSFTAERPPHATMNAAGTDLTFQTAQAPMGGYYAESDFTVDYFELYVRSVPAGARVVARLYDYDPETDTLIALASVEVTVSGQTPSVVPQPPLTISAGHFLVAYIENTNAATGFRDAKLSIRKVQRHAR